MKLIYSMVLIALIMSCNKDEPSNSKCYLLAGTNENLYYIQKPDLLNSQYRTGTYWTFIDSTNLVFDSVAVVEFNQDWVNIDNDHYESHLFKLVSYPTLDSLDYRIVFSGLFKDNSLSNMGTVIYDGFNTTVNMPEYYAVPMDSVYIYDRYYKEVLKVEIQNDPTEGNNHSVYYINSEFGFLRHDIYSGINLISKKLLINKHIIR